MSDLSNGVIFNDIERPLTQISRARHYSALKRRSKVFNKTERRAVSLRQLSFLYWAVSALNSSINVGRKHEPSKIYPVQIFNPHLSTNLFFLLARLEGHIRDACQLRSVILPSVVRCTSIFRPVVISRKLRMIDP